MIVPNSSGGNDEDDSLYRREESYQMDLSQEGSYLSSQYDDGGRSEVFDSDSEVRDLSGDEMMPGEVRNLSWLAGQPCRAGCE